MAGLGDLLDKRSSESADAAPSSVGSLFDQRAASEDLTASTAAPQPGAKAKPATPVWGGESFARGLGDMAAGTAQVLEHVPGVEQGLNLARAGIRKGLALAGASKDTQSLFDPVSAAEFDKVIAANEQTYAARRKAAGQNGIDWWRIGGNVANPLNYMGPGAAATAGGRIAAAAGMGAAQGFLQPSANEGDFWRDKAIGAGVGAATGGVLASLTEAVVPGVRAALGWLRGAKGVSQEASDAVADAITKGAAQNKGINPATLDPDALKGISAEVQTALNTGTDVSEKAIFNRAVAKSLPVPVDLLKGEANEDATQWGLEFGLRGVKGAEKITVAKADAQRALIANLDAIGAKDAPDIVSAGHAMGSKIDSIDAGLEAKISQAYSAVRNSAGQPASMDGPAVAQKIRLALYEDQFGLTKMALNRIEPETLDKMTTLPASISSTLTEIEEGRLPLNVSVAQALDKSWTRLQNPSADRAASRAIQIAKRELLGADVTDAVGEESIAMYKAAKSLAQQRFNLQEQIPAYLARVSGERNAEGDMFFRKFVMNATQKEATNLRGVLTQGDPDMDAMIGKAILGEIKDRSVNGAGANATLSEAKLGKFLDPVWDARLRAWLPSGAVDTLKNIHYVASLTERAPPGALPNRSGTAGTAVNLLGAITKATGGEVLARAASKIPLSSIMLPGLRAAADEAAAGRVAAAAAEATSGNVAKGAVLRPLR
jgi:hypothetical protein